MRAFHTNKPSLISFQRSLPQKHRRIRSDSSVPAQITSSTLTPSLLAAAESFRSAGRKVFGENTYPSTENGRRLPGAVQKRPGTRKSCKLASTVSLKRETHSSHVRNKNVKAKGKIIYSKKKNLTRCGTERAQFRTDYQFNIDPKSARELPISRKECFLEKLRSQLQKTADDSPKRSETN